jgi:membrane protein implicated in regulation of membrane protease activity
MAARVLRFSPLVKFLAITIDEIVLIPLALVLVHYFLPEFLLVAIVVGIVGGSVFVAIKWYLVYPQLLDGSYAYYDLQGVSGTAIETITSHSGRIRVGQEIWDARCDVGTISPGEQVRVISRDSMRVRVALDEIGTSSGY